MNGYPRGNYLSYEQINSIFPEKYKFNISSKQDRVVYDLLSGGKIAIASSKLHKDKIGVYNVVSKYYKEIGVRYIAFTAGFMGVFVVPIDIVCRYNKFSGWNKDTKKGRHHWVRLNRVADKWLFVNYLDPKENVDVTPFLIPYTFGDSHI